MQFPFFRFLILSTVATLFIPQVSAQVVEIPDPNIKKALREELQLSENTPITQQVMLRLTYLDAVDREISDLTGIEYATNLDYLNVGQNQISDIRPVAGLINLTGLAVWSNQVSDLTPIANLTNLLRLSLSDNAIENLEPLAGLTQLQVIDLYSNRVKDLTPLANLTDLTELILTRNQVSDLTPLATLVNLERLYLQHNLASDFTPLQELNLVEFYYDRPCDVPPLLPPIRKRIENRTFPSIFQSWDHVVGQDHLTVDQRYALHDLFWNPTHEWGLYWYTTLAEPTWGVSTSLIGDFEYAREIRQRWLELNPNMLFLADMNLAYH